MKNLRLNLLLSLLVYSLILITVIFYANRHILMTNLEEQVQKSQQLIEHHILADMRTVDNAHYYFDTNLSNTMEQELNKLREYYKDNQDITTWDVKRLSEHHNMDIYILNDKNTVVKTTFMLDLGLDFEECCSNFAKLLDERRLSGEFYSDGIDVSTTTGEIRKFGYLGTPDGKYLLELGVILEDVPVFKTFNFVRTANKLEELYEDLIDIQTINSGGIFLDDTSGERLTIKDMPKQFQQYFEKAQNTMKPTEYVVHLEDGYKETYRFLPYEAEAERGKSTKRIVFVKYGNSSELNAQEENVRQLVYLIMLALVTTGILLLVIGKLLSKTMKLATFDVLTGAYNRATYITKIDEILKKRKGTPGLLLVDLDNFKKANDQYGHAVGDKVLKDLTNALNDVVGIDGFVVRLGGDEFGVVLEETNEQDMQNKANAILHKVRHLKHQTSESDVWTHLSVSIGGAISINLQEIEIDLFIRADEALYKSKNAGKDRFTIASHE